MPGGASSTRPRRWNGLSGPRYWAPGKTYRDGRNGRSFRRGAYGRRRSSAIAKRPPPARPAPAPTPGSSAPRAPSLLRGRPRGRVLLWRRRQWVAHRLRSDLGADGLQGLDARRHEVAVAINEAVQFPEQSGRFFVGQVKVHVPKVGALTSGGESAPEMPVARSETSHKICANEGASRRRRDG